VRSGGRRQDHALTTGGCTLEAFTRVDAEAGGGGHDQNLHVCRPLQLGRGEDACLGANRRHHALPASDDGVQARRTLVVGRGPGIADDRHADRVEESRGWKERRHGDHRSRASEPRRRARDVGTTPRNDQRHRYAEYGQHDQDDADGYSST
jgi:hypothetical protein